MAEKTEAEARLLEWMLNNYAYVGHEMSGAVLGIVMERIGDEALERLKGLRRVVWDADGVFRGAVADELERVIGIREAPGLSEALRSEVFTRMHDEMKADEDEP